MTERFKVKEPHPRSEAETPRWLGWWRFGVAIGLLTILLLVVRLENIIDAFRRVNPAYALAIVGLLAVWLLLGGIKGWLLLGCLTTARLGTFLSAYLVSWATALLLPGQLGDATQVILLRRHGIPISKSSASYLLDKTISLGWMVLVAMYGIDRYTPLKFGVGWLLAPPLLLLLGLALALMLRRMSRRMGNLASRVQDGFNNLLENLKTFARRPGAVTLNISLTLIKWLLQAFIYQGAFYAFGHTIDFAAAATIPVMGSFIGYIPITVGGAGTSELTSIVLFARIGVEATAVLSAYLLIRATLLGGALLTICLSRTRTRRHGPPTTECNPAP
ncbi:MAG: flippase-like domain-containing protein [bacterium]|nr:flippase-like domain-containing protein [bacterium]